MYFLALIVIATACNPLKITDPTNPKFNPDKFEFSDYKELDDLTIAYKQLFPPGTPKEFVDRVLTKAGKAKAGQFKSTEGRYQLWGYRHPANDWKGGPQDLILYDNKDKVLNISVGGNSDIYADQPKHNQSSQEMN